MKTLQAIPRKGAARKVSMVWLYSIGMKMVIHVCIYLGSKEMKDELFLLGESDSKEAKYIPWHAFLLAINQLDSNLAGEAGEVSWYMGSM